MDISLQLHQQLNIHEATWMQVNEKTSLTEKTAIITTKKFYAFFLTWVM